MHAVNRLLREMSCALEILLSLKIAWHLSVQVNYPLGSNVCLIVNNNIAACPAEWESWGQWSHCSTTCGNGSRVRGRGCSEPAFGGNEQCPGNSTQLEDCMTSLCPGEPLHVTFVFLTFLNMHTKIHPFPFL